MLTPKKENLDFSVQIDGGTPREVAQLITSLLEVPEGCEDEYEYIPGWNSGGYYHINEIGGARWTGPIASTYTERTRIKSEGRMWSTEKDKIFNVRNVEGTDIYDIEFRNLEAEMAFKVRTELEAAYKPHLA